MLRIAPKFLLYFHRRIIEASFVLPFYFMRGDLSLAALTTISLRERQTLNYHLALIIVFRLRSRLVLLCSSMFMKEISGLGRHRHAVRTI